MTTTTAYVPTTCPFCAAPVLDTRDVEGWPVLLPCEHPAPFERRAMIRDAASLPMEPLS